MWKDTSRGRGKCSLFEKGQIFGMHQTEETSKEIAETTEIGLRSVQRILKNWKDSGEPSSSRKNCGRKKSRLIVIGNHLNIWWNQIIEKQQGYV